MSTDKTMSEYSPVENLAALMNALEIPPSAATLGPVQLGVIGKAIAKQCKRAEQQEKRIEELREENKTLRLYYYDYCKQSSRLSSLFKSRLDHTQPPEDV